MSIKEYFKFFLKGAIFSFMLFPSPTFGKLALPFRDYIQTVRSTDFYSNPLGNTFLSTLAKEYKSYALFKANYTPDYNRANHFAIKALNAYNGENVYPENIYEVGLPEDSLIQISYYYTDLLNYLKSDLSQKYPRLMAEAQAKFDCWVDSEVNRLSPKQAQTCKARFLKARNYIIEKLELEEGCNKCKKKEKLPEKKVVKKYDGKTIFIPKWPNISAINNNPPIPVLRQTVINGNTQKKYSNIAPTSNSEIEDLKNAINRIEEEIKEISKKISNQNSTDIREIEKQIDKLKQSITSAQQPDISKLQQQLYELEKKLITCSNNKKDYIEKEDTHQEITQQQNLKPSQKTEEYKEESSEDEDKNKNKNKNKDKTEDEPENEIEEEIIEEPKINDEEESDDIEDEEVEDDTDNEETEPEFETVSDEELVETEVVSTPSILLPYELFFDWNKANVEKKYDTALKDIATNAGKSKEIILITGHTDASGTPEYNKKLSQRRAENVGKIIMSYGVPREKIVLKGVGSTEPKVKTKPGERNAENRRVVIN